MKAPSFPLTKSQKDLLKKLRKAERDGVVIRLGRP